MDIVVVVIANVERITMRCENELGQHEFVTVMLLSDFSRYDGFFNHLGMFSTKHISSSSPTRFSI